MEISPIIVSMKTASVSIVITFFLGLAAAYGVERIRSRKLQLVCDGSGDFVPFDVPFG